MIPETDTLIKNEAKYFLLEDDDVMKIGDEYYNNFQDLWMPIEDRFIENKFYHD